MSRASVEDAVRDSIAHGLTASPVSAETAMNMTPHAIAPSAEPRAKLEVESG
jgi:hypothetical protein